MRYQLLFLCLFFSKSMFATIAFIERWERFAGNKRTVGLSELKTVYLISDYHQYLRNNRKQLKNLLHFIRSKKNLSLIAEDSHTFGDNKLLWKELSGCVDKSEFPLQNSVSLAHYCGLVSTSVECRPRTKNLNAQVGIIDIINTTNQQVEKILEYDDGSVLNKEYRQYVNRYKNKVVLAVAQLFKNIAAQNCSIKDIDYNLLKYPSETDDIFNVYEAPYDLESYDLQQRVREVLTCYAKEVIDFKILHALVEHAEQGVETVVIYAGSGHIDRIKPILEKLGYRFSKYPTINYDKNGEIQPLNVAQAFQEMDPTYNPDEQLPKETIDYFFEYKEAEEENPCFRTRSMMKMFVTAADSLRGYRNWKQGYPRLERVVSVTLATGALTVLWCIVNICCKSK